MSSAAGCCLCGLTVEVLVETAHLPNRRTAPTETARLCILCHRAYDVGLMKDEEIKAARGQWLLGQGAPFTPLELHALWASREPDCGTACTREPRSLGAPGFDAALPRAAPGARDASGCPLRPRRPRPAKKLPNWGHDMKVL